ncbi:hypothetical protein CYMTET_34946 [Cymbomonas tetramitiformis]|uniref:Uncharacterized protein n=1 Tax=Cymbomonas tetramitiformis TaxID=36881 RepID=A0AAE0FA36_9CHLO|nr:hypothetical protein CYMTET_34946 [Cymbomonas tetramitiformis]
MTSNSIVALPSSSPVPEAGFFRGPFLPGVTGAVQAGKAAWISASPANAAHLTHSTNKCWPDGEPMFKVGDMSTRGDGKLINRQPRTIHQIITSIQNEGQCLKQDSWQHTVNQREVKQDAAHISSLRWDHAQSQIPNLKSEFGHSGHQKNGGNGAAANHLKAAVESKSKFRRMVFHIDASLAEERRDAEYKAKCLKYMKADKFPSHDPKTGLPITRFIHF